MDRTHSESSGSPNPRRREVLQAAAWLLGAAASATVSQALEAAELAPTAAAADGFTAGQWRSIVQLSDLILPPTDTPGAVEAGVPEFIATIVQDWYRPAERERFLAGLGALDAYCQEEHGTPFHETSDANRRAALQAQQFLAQRYRQPPLGPFGSSPPLGDDAPFFLKLRELVVLGYYTSEVGATQELAYTPVPGRFNGAFPLVDAPRQFSR